MIKSAPERGKALPPPQSGRARTPRLSPRRPANVRGIFTTSFFVSTQVGLRSEGWHEVTLDLARNPGYAAVGRTYSSPDGSKVMVTGISGTERGKPQVSANVYGTHRYALALFPLRWEHSFEMDRPALDWTLRQATNQPPAALDHAVGRQWHVLN